MPRGSAVPALFLVYMVNNCPRFIRSERNGSAYFTVRIRSALCQLYQGKSCHRFGTHERSSAIPGEFSGVDFGNAFLRMPRCRVPIKWPLRTREVVGKLQPSPWL